MPRVAGAAEAADDAVRMDVHGHPGEEQRAAGVDEGLREPPGVVVRRGDVEDPAALHQGVERVEDHTHEDDAERHFRLPADEQREDEGPLEVVRLEEGEQRERSGLPHAVGAGPEHAHEDEYRGFHHHPSDAVRDGWSVAAVEQVAVAGFEEVQRHEHPERRDGHDDKENVETLFHRRPGYSRRINTVKVVFFSGPGKSSGPGRLSVSSGNGADSSGAENGDGLRFRKEAKTVRGAAARERRVPRGVPAMPAAGRRPPGRRGGCTRAPGRAGCAGRVSACKPCPSVSRFSRTGGATVWGTGASRTPPRRCGCRP